MKLIRRAAALCLCAALLLPAAFASGDGLTADARQQDLDTLYDTLKEHHPNMFNRTPESEFLTAKAVLESRLDGLSDVDFALELQSLVARIGDSHTTTSLPSAQAMKLFPFSLTWFDGDWVLTTVTSDHAGDLGKTVIALNGVPMEDVVARFATFVSADNEVKLRRQTRQIIYAQDILVHLGLAEADKDLTLTVADAKGVESQITLSALPAEEVQSAELASLSQQRTGKPATAYDKSKYYFSLPLDADTYYVQYNRCQEDPELPMEDFAAQVAKDLERGAYRQVLLDLRNNGGGSDGVIFPLLAVLEPMVRAGDIRLYGLIGETTFSSAVINGVMIQEAGGLLAGSPTSGSVDHFGSTGSFTLPNSGLRVTCSSKWISLSGLLEAAQGYGVESLRPDFPVEQTLSDYLAGKDTLVDTLLAQGLDWRAPDRGEMGLTRAHLVSLLYAQAQAAGKNVAAPENRFADVLPCMYYTAAVDWAAQNGITLGGGDDSFHSAQLVTRAEAAVLLARFADYMGVTLPQGGTAPADAPVWAQEALGRCAGLEGMAGGAAGTFTRTQGQALVRALCG